MAHLQITHGSKKPQEKLKHFEEMKCNLAYLAAAKAMFKGNSFKHLIHILERRKDLN